MTPEMVLLPVFEPLRVRVRSAPTPVVAFVWELKIAALKTNAPLPLFWMVALPVWLAAGVPIIVPISMVRLEVSPAPV